MVDIIGATLKPENTLATASGGLSYLRGVGPSGQSVRANPGYVNVKDFGALGDNATDDTAAVNAAKTFLRAAGGGTLYFPEGIYLLDSFDWDWIAGGIGKLVLRGDGSATTLKKRVDDDAVFVTIGRNDSTQTFQGQVFIKDICIDGINGGGERVLDLWSLTLTDMSNVRVRYGDKAICLNNCVTVNGTNVTGTNSVTGLYLIRFDFPDTTYSDPNLITFIAGAFINNTGLAIDFHDGSQLVLVGTQIENNGTTANNSTGGIWVRSTAGDVGLNRKGHALTCTGVWFESNKGRAPIILEGGASLFSGCHGVANADSTREIYSNGGKYTLVECSFPTGRVGGNIEDTASAATGNLILGGEIASAVDGLDQTKTTLIEVQTGTGASATRVTRNKGRAPVVAPATTEIMVQSGIDNQASGSTVTFPVAFGATPVVTLTTSGNAPGRIAEAKFYSLSTTGFTIEKTEVVSGSSTVSTTSNTTHWIAVGNR